MRSVGAALSAGALAVALGVASCGGDDPSRFSDEVSAVEDAVDAGDRGAALHALDVLRIEITAARQAGELDGERVAELEALLHEGRLLVDAVLPPPTTAPPTTAPPTTAPPTTQAPTTRAEERDGDEEDEDQEDEDDDEVDRGPDDDGGPGNGRGQGRGPDRGDD